MTAMGRKLFSVNALADELGRDRRTIDRALTGVLPDGVARGHPAWFLSTALRYVEPRLPGQQGVEDQRVRAADRIEALAREVDVALRELAAEPSVARRRKMVEGGHLHIFGQFDTALMDDSVLNETERIITREHRNRISATALRRILQLCDWTVADAR
jgi:hypothetical protein